MSHDPVRMPGRPKASKAAPPSRWILSSGLDLLLFIGTPALIVPVILLARGRFTTAQVYLFVASFGAVGHHLPGMMRAYGDGALFRRFRVRFVLAPLVLLASCVALAFTAKAALTLAVFAWGAWHGAMQVHGFARIYDAKWGSTRRLTAGLDQLLALCWFATVLAASDARVHFILDHAMQAGLPAVPATALRDARFAMVALTLLVTALWLAHAFRLARAGRPPSPVKLALLASSIAFYALANMATRDLLLSVILFEAFHDVQYLTIVWLFNRRRADADPMAGRFTRFLFRPRAALLVAYVALCFAYGGLNLIQARLPQATVATALAGVLAASALLHFYYDGFIWKLRESGTRAGLGLASESDAAPSAWRGPLVHALKWSALFLLPMGVLAATTRSAPPEDVRVQRLADALPDDAGAQRNAAIAMRRSGDLDGAVSRARRALELAAADPDDTATLAMTRGTLGTLLGAQALQRAQAGDAGSAAALLKEGAALDAHAADALAEASSELLSRGDAPRAEALARVAVAGAPSHGVAHYGLAAALAAQGRLPEAHVHALRAATLLPSREEPKLMLARIRERIEAQAR